MVPDFAREAEDLVRAIVDEIKASEVQAEYPRIDESIALARCVDLVRVFMRKWGGERDGR